MSLQAAGTKKLFEGEGPVSYSIVIFLIWIYFDQGPGRKQMAHEFIEGSFTLVKGRIE